MGGELHPLKYGSYYTDKNRLFAVIKAEEAFILKSPGQNDRRIWIDLYKTKLDREVIQTLVQHIGAIRHKILKLCLVGCSLPCTVEIKHQMRKTVPDLARTIRFFSDPEKAKQWLINGVI